MFVFIRTWKCDIYFQAVIQWMIQRFRKIPWTYAWICHTFFLQESGEFQNMQSVFKKEFLSSKTIH